MREGAGSEGEAGRTVNEGERRRGSEVEKALETAKRRGGRQGPGWRRPRGCGRAAAEKLRRRGGSRTRACLSHTQPGRSSPWQNLSAFIGASVTLLIGY